MRVPGTSILDASIIKTPFQEVNPADKSDEFGLMIACDGYSMERGINEFWDMVVAQNVRYVTAYNEQFGHNWYNVFRYFPDEQNPIMKCKNYNIVNQVKMTKDSGYLITRVLDVFDVKTGEKVHTLTHIHFYSWEDFEVPADKAMDDLMQILEHQADFLFSQIENIEKQGARAKPARILMHCLAGRGRTGTALAIVNAIISIKWQIMQNDLTQKADSITAANVHDHLILSIFSIVRRLREQRKTAVQASEQYSYIYSFVDSWLTKKIKDAKNLPTND